MGTAGVGSDPSVRVNDGSTHGLILDGESGRLIGKLHLSRHLPLPFPLSFTLNLSFSLLPLLRTCTHTHTAHIAHTRTQHTYSTHTHTPSYPLHSVLDIYPLSLYHFLFLFLFLFLYLLFHNHPFNTL